MNMKKALVLSAGTVTFLIVAFLLHTFVPVIENALYDVSFSFKPSTSPESVVIVGVDAKSISNIGTWAWPRSTMAALVERIDESSPKAIALDFRFPRNPDDRVRHHDDSLAAVFSRVDGLVLPFHAGAIANKAASTAAVIPNEAIEHRFLMLKNQDKLSEYMFYSTQRLDIGDVSFYQHTDRSGFLNVSTRKTTQKIWEVIHVIKAGNEYFPSFAVAAVAAYKGLKPEELALTGKPSVIVGENEVKLSRYAGSSLLNFRGPPGTVKTVSASDVLNGTVEPSVFRGKLVFVGITDAAIFRSEFFPTPVSAQFPGVEIWATASVDLIEGSSIKSTSGALVSGVWVLALLIFPGLAIFIPGRRKVASVVGGLVLLGVSLVLWVVLFRGSGVWWNPGYHVYAWVFSLLWLAAQKADPTLVEVKGFELEPDSADDADSVPAPKKDDYLSEMPKADTCSFVASKLSAKLPLMEVEEGTMVESEGASVDDALKAEAWLIEQIRKLAGGEILKMLGSGGMADVYLVWNPRLEVYRAIKVIKPGQSEQLLERFETEIKIFANLHHQNIVQCYNAGEWYGLPYLEMEYVPGAALDDVLKKCTVLSADQALAVGILVCRALHYAHQQTVSVHSQAYKGVIHRDLKPANIMLSQGGRIKLTDFGIARPQAVSLHTGDSTKVVGTLPYLAPEQLDGKDITARTDIYALGVTLYELLIGERAFPQGDLTTLVNAKVKGQVKSLADSALVPKALAEVIHKAVSVSPKDRYDTALAMGRDLERVLSATTTLEQSSRILRGLVSRYWG